MALRLDVLDSPDGSYKVSLEGQVFTIKTRYNSRTESWYLSVETNEGVIITSYEKMIPKQALVQYNTEMFASGNLYLVNNTQDASLIPERDSLGSGKIFELYYLTEDEISQL